MEPDRIQELQNTFVRVVQELEKESGESHLNPGSWRHGNWIPDPEPKPSLLTRFKRWWK